MNEEKNMMAEANEETAQTTQSERVIDLGKPYKFEGQTYSEIDLSGLDSLTAEDMIAAEKHLMRTGVFSPLPEMTVEYVQFIAARASGQPVEFFKGLPPKDAIKVKNRVTSFFYGED
mgnify:CR=1 FL=1